jgi:hypothetical protein
MPQLAFETYISQYFWLFIIFFLFNHFILHQFIPDIATLIKIRKKFINKNEQNNNTIDKNTLAIQLPIFNTNNINNNNLFNTTKNNWIKNNLK